MPRAPRKTPKGRTSDITSTVHRDGRDIPVTDAILEDIRSGLPIDLAIRRSGVSTVAAGDWLRLGQKVIERQRLNPDHPTTVDENAYRQFSIDVERARGEAEATLWNALDALTFGTKKRKVVVKTDPSRRDPNGQPLIVEQQVTEEDVLPSERTLMWRLAVQYGRATPIEVKINDGVLSDEDRAQAMLDGLAAHLERRAQSRKVDAIEANGHEDPPTNGST